MEIKRQGDRETRRQGEMKSNLPVSLSPCLPVSNSSRLQTSGVEQLTQAYGHDLFARLERRGPALFTPGWFDERMMEWSMADEAVKVQFFRFIDVLPQLSTPAQISRHLREYFAEARAGLPSWAAFGARWLPRDGM